MAVLTRCWLHDPEEEPKREPRRKPGHIRSRLPERPACLRTLELHVRTLGDPPKICIVSDLLLLVVWAGCRLRPK